MENFPSLSRPKDPTVLFYDNNGKEYVENQREFYSDTMDTGRKFFQEALLPDIKNMTIADIGCGAGDDLISYKEMGATKVIGIDPSSTMLAEAKETVKKSGLDIELLVGEWTHLPLANESLDAITARYSFHVVPDFEKTFKEVARVLKKDGLFLIGAPHPLHDAKMVREQKLKPGGKMKIPIFNGKFVVDIPPHTMDEYLSKTCLEHFNLEDKLEYSMHEDSSETQPTGLLLKLRRK